VIHCGNDVIGVIVDQHWDGLLCPSY